MSISGFFRAFALCLVVSVSLASPMSNADVPPHILKYAALPSIDQVSISPGGKYFAYRNTIDGQPFLRITRVSDRAEVVTFNLRDMNAYGMYFLSDRYLVLEVSNVMRIPGFLGKPEVSTAMTYDLEEKKMRQLLSPGDKIYPGQTGLGEIIGISDDHKYVYMPAITGTAANVESSDLSRSVMRVKLSNPKRPRTHYTSALASTDYFLGPDGEVLIDVVMEADRKRYRILHRKDKKWETLYEDETDLPRLVPVGLTADYSSLVAIGYSKNSDREQYLLVSLKDGAIRDAGLSRDDADIDDVITSTNRVVLGIQYSGFLPEYHFFDEKLNARMKKIGQMFAEHAVRFVDMTDDGKHIVVLVKGSSFAGEYVLFSEGEPPISIAKQYPHIATDDIHPLATWETSAEDGLKIPVLLTLPRHKLPDIKQLPAVMLPHGGPRSYDQVDFDWLAQALAEEGYLVIQPQFRGSSGFGWEHIEAGHGEWGKKMQSDLTDTLKGLARAGYVDLSRVCIAGGSYGGYAALAGGAFTPEKYRCVVSFNGVSDLRKMLYDTKRQADKSSSVVAYWEMQMANGEVIDKELDRVSPARHAENFMSPVLLLHAERDETVPFEQSKDMFKALKSAGKEVTLIEMKDDNHYLMDQDSRVLLLKNLLPFLREHLSEAPALATQ